MNTKKIDILVTVFGLCGAVVFFLFYSQAFPSAALHLEYSRSEIEEQAQSYMRAMGYSLDDYEFVLSFGQDTGSSTFLQRQRGIAEMNRLVEEENIPLWYWHARWFKPKQEEEFALLLLPDGQINGFTHSLPEADPGAALSQEDALAIAEAYLKDNIGWDLAQWESMDQSSVTRPGGRVDHSFGWMRRNFDVEGGTLRLYVGVKGDKIGSYNYSMDTPNAFWREWSESRTLPNAINGISSFIGVNGFETIAMIAVVLALLQGKSFFRSSIPLVLLVIIVDLLDSFNSFALAKANYWTASDYTLFWTDQIWYAFYGAGLRGFNAWLILEGGLYLARYAWPHQDKLLPRSADRWQELARSGWRGFMLGGVLLGYVVLFYLMAVKLLGGWAPVGVNYSNAYATPLPFLSSLYSGLIPATHEEILFRLVGVSLILLLARKKWLALLIPGALWAFAHLSYIRDPFYMRGVELLITAVLVEGLFFLLFDLTTTIVAHMTYNAMLGLLPMLLSQEPYFIFSGGVGVVLLLSPVLVGLLMSRLRGRQLVGTPRLRPILDLDLPGLPAAPVDWQKLLLDDRAVLVGLEVGGRLAGAAAGRVREDGVGELAYVIVDPAWRGQYWGTRLVEAVCAGLRERGAASIETEIETKDRNSVKFLIGLEWYAARNILSPRPMPYARQLWHDAWQKTAPARAKLPRLRLGRKRPISTETT